MYTDTQTHTAVKLHLPGEAGSSSRGVYECTQTDTAVKLHLADEAGLSSCSFDPEG